MALKIIGKGAFGADSSNTGAQSVTETKSVTETLALNKDGDVIGVALTQETTEKTVEVIVTSDANVPAIGDTFDGGTVTQVEKNSSNTDFQRYTVTTKIWGSLSAGGGE